MSRLYALCTETPLVHPADLYELSRALEIAAGHLAAAWATEPPAIEVCNDPSTLPDGCCPVVFLDESTQPGVLAEHYVGDNLEPAARVYMAPSSGLNSGDWSASAGADHEIKEAEIDPLCDGWRDHPTRPGIEVALEVSDPCENQYSVSYNGQSWLAENFVLPSWFESDGKAPFDHLNTLTAPGQISANGYVILRDKSTGEVWTEDTFGSRQALSSRKKPGAAHPWARSARRISAAKVRP